MKRFTISPEATLKETVQLINKVNDKAELIVYGSPVIMYLEHDLFENIVEDDKQLYLVDDKGFKHPVYKDNKNRNHIIMYKDLCYLPILKSLYQAGLSNFRIEARYLDVEALEKVIKTYQNALEDLDNAEKLMENFKPQRVGFTLGALEFD